MNIDAVIGFVFGLFVGANLGVIMVALATAAKRHDEQSESYWSDNSSKE